MYFVYKIRKIKSRKSLKFLKNSLWKVYFKTFRAGLKTFFKYRPAKAKLETTSVLYIIYTYIEL